MTPSTPATQDPGQTAPPPPLSPAPPDPSDPSDDSPWRRSWHARSGRLNTSRRWALEELAPRHELSEKATHSDRAAAVVVEIGAGSGEAAVALAMAHPDWLVIAAEVHTASRASLLLALHHHGLTNLAVEGRDGRQVLTEVARDRPVDLVRILFPDPWPKRRHHPRRLVNTDLLELLHHSLRPTVGPDGGVVELATDDAAYARVMTTTFRADPRFQPAPPDVLLSRPPTYYETRARQAGRAVQTQAYARAPRSNGAFP